MHKHTSSSSPIDLGRAWMRSPHATVTPEWYCQTRDVFQARLQTFHDHLKPTFNRNASLLTAIVGEIGNNSFDHNLGIWPDVPGILFTHDIMQRIIIVADRGVGIFTTIHFVMPDVKNDKDALRIAFTKVISGRKDEHRGNGLKFVLNVIKNNDWNLQFYSGKALAQIDKIHNLNITKQKETLQGCFAIIRY